MVFYFNVVWRPADIDRNADPTIPGQNGGSVLDHYHQNCDLFVIAYWSQPVTTTNLSKGGFAGERRDSDRLYRAAVRHSRFVRLLRICVPVVLIAALLFTIGTNYLPTAGVLRVPGEIGKLIIKGTKVTMQQPRLTGFTNDGRPYEVHADFAEQDITNPDVMELHTIEGRSELENKGIVSLTSNRGVFDMKTELVTLTDNVHILSTTGYEARLSEVTIDVHKSNAHSEKPVWMKLDKQSVINANKLDIIDGGDVIRFSGGVSMITQPN